MHLCLILVPQEYEERDEGIAQWQHVAWEDYLAQGAAAAARPYGSGSAAFPPLQYMVVPHPTANTHIRQPYDEPFV
jgi:hypothetical protein